MPQWELANADCILVMGSNMAENHPIAFRFALQAKAKGATLIHVDPRFTRTSALADIYAPVRAGTDVAFLGGIAFDCFDQIRDQVGAALILVLNLRPSGIHFLVKLAEQSNQGVDPWTTREGPSHTNPP